ncbi:glycosyltransferase family 25 protein [Yersinia enterocolitica]
MENIEIRTISMLSAEERRTNFSHLMLEHKLNFFFTDAINGKELSAKDYFPLSKNPNYFFNRKHIITPSEVGCRLSHKKAISDFIMNSQKEWLVVFEDDIKFDNNLVSFLEKINKMTLSDEVIIHLGGQDGLSSYNRLFFKKNEFINNFKIDTVRSFCLRWLYRTCGYIVNRNAAKKLLQVHNTNTFVADDWSYIRKKTNIKNIYFINLVTHPIDLSSSSIEAERT